MDLSLLKFKEITISMDLGTQNIIFMDFSLFKTKGNN